MKRLFRFLAFVYYTFFPYFVMFNVDMVDTEKPIINRVGLN